MARLMIQIGRCAMKTFISQGRNDLFGSTAQSRTSLVALRSITTTRCLRAERWYADSAHVWITVDGKIGIVGITDYAKDLVFEYSDVKSTELPDVGSTVKKNEECGEVSTSNGTSSATLEFESPVSGKVIEKNKKVENKPSLINTSCYEEGWLFKVELNNLDEIKNLMNEEAYNTYIKSIEEEKYRSYIETKKICDMMNKFDGI